MWRHQVQSWCSHGMGALQVAAITMKETRNTSRTRTRVPKTHCLILMAGSGLALPIHNDDALSERFCLSSFPLSVYPLLILHFQSRSLFFKNRSQSYRHNKIMVTFWWFLFFQTIFMYLIPAVKQFYDKFPSLNGCPDLLPLWEEHKNGDLPSHLRVPDLHHWP